MTNHPGQRPAWVAPVFVILAVLAIVFGALLGLSYDR